MNRTAKKIIGFITIIVLYLIFKRSDEVEKNDYKNIAYTIDGQEVVLVNGVAETPAAPQSITKVVTMYFGNEARGDLNNDGVEDVSFLLTEESGGSGTFYYVVTALGTATGYKGTNAVFLGDRIAPQSTYIKNEKLTVSYADRTQGESMDTVPTRGVSKTLTVIGGELVETR